MNTQYKEHSIFVRTGCSVKGCKRKWYPFLQKNTILIYPEVVFGNPLKADRVVRWLLYYNKHYKNNGGKPIGYEKSDLFYAYREVFNDDKVNPECRILCTPFFDLELYQQTNFGDRKGKCYVIKKGAVRNDLPVSFDGIIFDRLTETEKVKVFNECEYCISYDTQTSYSTIAAICGCISVVVPEVGKSREDYRPNGEPSYGEAFGFSEKEIQYAVSTQNEARNYYVDMNNYSKESVASFIYECERLFRTSG